MTTTDTQRGTSDAGLRVTSNEVDYYLQYGDQDGETIKDICRDWLDMQAARGRVQTLVQAVEEAGPWPHITYWPFKCAHCGASSRTRDELEHAADCHGVRISNALADLTSGGAS